MGAASCMWRGQSIHAPCTYARAVRPGSLDLGPSEPMTGQHEKQVTYPQFYLMRGGDLVFVYRDGQSGRGDVMLSRWNGRTWSAVAHPLISGEESATHM